MFHSSKDTENNHPINPSKEISKVLDLMDPQVLSGENAKILGEDLWTCCYLGNKHNSPVTEKDSLHLIISSPYSLPPSHSVAPQSNTDDEVIIDLSCTTDSDIVCLDRSKDADSASVDNVSGAYDTQISDYFSLQSRPQVDKFPTHEPPATPLVLSERPPDGGSL